MVRRPALEKLQLNSSPGLVVSPLTAGTPRFTERVGTMSKESTAQKSAPAAAAPVSGAPSAPAPAAPPVSKDDVRKLFVAYDEQTATIEGLESKLAKAKAARSETIERIVKVAGGQRRFKHPVTGAVFAARKNRNGEWGFGDPSKQDVMDLTVTK